jgi:hypothetical protein
VKAADPKSTLMRGEPVAEVPSLDGAPIVQAVAPIFQYPKYDALAVAVVPIAALNVCEIVSELSVTADMSAAPMGARTTPGIAARVTSSPVVGAVPVVPSDFVQLAPRVGSVEDVEDQK